MLTPRRLIITDGSLPALAALALQDRPDQAILWVPQLGHAAPRRLDAIARQSAHFRIDRTLGPGSKGSLTVEDAGKPATALSDASLLIAALLTARELRCSRVVWPVQAGMDLDRIATVHEVVMFASHLTDLDSVTAKDAAPEIRTPVLDCTDDQIIDLITSSGVPTSLAWWCDHEMTQPCGSCASCRRWDGARRSMSIVS